MQIQQPGLYHIYNRGNFKQQLFFSDDNYLFFLEKCKRYLLPYSDILGWCLMPNHFHFLFDITPAGFASMQVGNLVIPTISNGFRLVQSSYAKAVNKQRQRFGNLFQQKTHARLIESGEHVLTTFHYIHQNPVKAQLVTSPELWHYSSYRDYAGLRNGKLCNKLKARTILGLDNIDLLAETNKQIEPERIRWIF